MAELERLTGRPRDYDRDVYLPELEHAFSLGMPLRFCADLIGVPKSTLESWLNSDPVFSDKLSRARARGVQELMEIVKANPKTAGGAGWILERRYREDFGQRVDVMHSIDEAQIAKLAEQYGVDASEVQSALQEAAKLLQAPKR